MRLPFLQHNASCTWLLLLVVAAMLSACSSGEPDPIQDQVSTYKLQLQIFPYDILTRADEDKPWGENNQPDDGIDYDRTITTVGLFLLHDNGKLTPLDALKEPGSSYVYTCEVNEKTPGFTISADKTSATFSGRVMALANVADMNSPLTEDTDINGMISENWISDKIPFEVKFSESSTDWHIPMWGVKTFTNVRLEPNKITRLDAIEMLRAVSKIVIKLDPSLINNYEIGNIEMAEGSPKLYKKGFTLPNGAIDKTQNPWKIISETKNLGISDCYSRYTGSEGYEISSLSASNFKKIINDTQCEWYTYVGENNVADDELFKFKVTLNLKNTGALPVTGTLSLSYYKAADDYWVPDPDNPITHIRRNYIYEFTLKLKGLQLRPTVKAWEPVPPVYGDMAESYPGIPTASFADKTLTLTCNNCPQATIWYKIGDGDWEEYNSIDKITSLTESCTVQFYAEFNGVESPFGTYEFMFATYQVKSPVITYDTTTGLLSMTCATGGATIRYTTDSYTNGNETNISVPTATTGEVYDPSQKVKIVENRTIRARAFKDGLYDSEVTTFVVSTKATVTTPTGTIIDNQLVLTCSDTEANIQYQKGNDWEIYTGPLSPGRDETVPFRATREGYANSPVVYFQVSNYIVKKPRIEYADGIVKVICETINSDIYYTIDGSEPTQDSLPYSGPIQITESCIIKAKAFRAGFYDSEKVELSVDI